MSKYGDALDAMDQDRDQQAATVATVASKYNPDQYAQAISKSEQVGIPARLIAENPDAYNRPSKYGVALDKQDAPATQEWLGSLDNAAIAHDDVEALSGLERAMRLMRKGYDFNDKVQQRFSLYPRALAGGAIKPVGSGLLSGTGRILEAAGRYTERGIRASGGDWLADAMTSVQTPWWITPSEILKRPGGVVERAGEKVDVPKDQQALDTDIVGGVGQIGSQVIIQMLTGGTGSTVSMLGQGADIMGDRAEAAGATPEQTDAAVLIGASVTGLTERYGLDVLLNRVPPSIKNAVLRKITDIAVGGGIEAAQEVVEGVLHNLTAKAIFDPNTPLFDGIEREALAAGGSGALARAVLNAVIPGRAVSFADQDRVTAQQIAQVVQSSKLAERSPQKLEELVASIKAQTGAEFAYVDAEAFRTLYQSDQEAAQAAAELTGSAQSYYEASVSNSKLAVPIEKYVSKLAANKNAQSLLDHVSFTADGMTAAEAKESRETFDEKAKEIADREVTEARPDSSQAVYEDVLGQLIATGMERSTAEKNAALTQVVFRTLGQRTGMDAQQLYQRYGLKIQREIPGILGAASRVDVGIDPLIDQLRSGDIPTEAKAMAALEAGDVRAMDRRATLIQLSDFLGKAGVDLQTTDNAAVRKLLADESGIQFDQGDKSNTAGLGGATDIGSANEQPVRAAGTEADQDRRTTVGGGRPAEGWQAATRIRGKSGKPIRLYRGSSRPLSASDFEDSTLGAATGHPSSGLGVFFTTDQGDASRYGEVSNAFLDLRNPKLIKIEDVPAFDSLEEAIAWREKQKAAGHDGLVISASHLGGPNWVVAFSPNQVIRELEQRFYQARRGAIQFGANRQFTISLLEKADLSTYLHESGHFYLEILGDLAEDANASQQIKDDYAAILKWMGVKDRAGIKTDQHEQWARGFEAYLMEGKAPSVEMQSVFGRFRAWLVSVYRSLTKLNVDLTDDVRRVMDRLVATDEEIAAAEESQNYAPIFANAEEAGMSPEEWAAYKDIATRAHQEATQEMTDRALKQLTREQKAWWKEERGKMVEAITAEVNAQPVYRALAFLQKGQNADGTALPEGVQAVKLNKAALVDQYGKEFLKRLPRGLTAKEGVNADVVAQMFEFPSGDAMVEALANARPKAQLIEMEADARMREKYGDMLTDGSLAEQAMQSVHTEGRAKVMAAELKALNRKRREVKPFVKAAKDAAAREQKQAREANAATLPGGDELRSIKAGAERIIQAKKVRDIQPNLYRLAEAKAARKAFDLAGKGKYEEAYIEKRRQILNHELYRAAVKAREEIDATVDYMRGFSKPAAQQRLGKAGGQYRQQINAILERFDFSNVSNIADIERTALATWVEEQRAAGKEVVIPDYVLNEARKTPYKELLLAELQGLRDSVKNIDHLSKLKNKLLASAKKRDFDEMVDSVVSSIDENHTRTAEVIDFAPRFGQKLKKGMKRYFAEHTKMEFLFSWLDGEKDLGPAWEAMFKPISDAENVEQAKMRDARGVLTKILGRYSKSELGKMFVAKVHVPEVGKSFTRASLLSVALNSGNEYNRDVMVRGYGWNESQLEAILAKLDNRDWDTVEAIWEHIDSYWPEISKLQEELAGVPPEKVEALPFTAPNGRQLRGGYYPIKYDADTSERQNQQDETQSVAEMFGGNFARIATRQGHTKARTDSGGKKVKLDLGVYTEHVTNVIHDLAFRRAVIDVDRVIQDGRVEKAVIETAGREMYRQLRPWLRNIAADYRQPMNTVEKLLNHARAGASIVSMGYKITTAIVQPLGYLQSVEMLGAKYSMIGLKEFYGKGTPQGMARAKDFVFERSEQMRNRMTTFDRDVRDQLKGLQDRGSKIRRSFFFMTGAMDMTVSIPTWLGAYRKAMDGAVDGLTPGDEAAAIDYADSTVRKSQSAGGAKDLAGIQSGHPLFKLFTTFYSYFNVMYNLMARRVGMTKSPGDIPALIGSLATLWFVPAILAEILAQRGPDEDEEWGAWFKKTWTNWAMYPLQGLIGFRELVQAMGPYGYDGPPALDAISQTGAALQIPAKALDEDEEISRSDVKAAVMAVSYWGHLPGRQLWITGEYLYDYMTGEEEDFSIKDALFARPQ